MTKFWQLAAAAVFLGGVAAPASAATFLFDFKAVDMAQSARFTIDDDRTPTQRQAQMFAYNNVSVLRGTATVAQTVRFYTVAAGGGFNFNTAGFDAFGTQVFTGTTGNPTFLSGVFTMRRSNTSTSTPIGTLTISQVVTAVPEPASWAFLLLGFAGIGSMLRHGAGRQARVRVRKHGECIPA